MNPAPTARIAGLASGTALTGWRLCPPPPPVDALPAKAARPTHSGSEPAKQWMRAP